MEKKLFQALKEMRQRFYDSMFYVKPYDVKWIIQE